MKAGVVPYTRSSAPAPALAMICVPCSVDQPTVFAASSASSSTTEGSIARAAGLKGMPATAIPTARTIANGAFDVKASPVAIAARAMSAAIITRRRS